MSHERERREDSIVSKIAVPVFVAVLIALVAGGTAPWWWDRLFPPGAETPAPTLHTPTPALETPSPALETPTPALETPTPAVETPPPSEEPTFLGQLQGDWTLQMWQERPGPVTTGFRLLDGSLVVDAFGNAAWDLELDDGGPTPDVTPGLRCLGVVDAAAETLAHVTGRLTVNGEDLIGEERDWTSNLQSLRGDAYVAFCGSTLSGTQLFVYDTTKSDYELTITIAGDAARTRLLTMRNAAGTFTWKEGG